MLIYIIRHGETIANVRKSLSGFTDDPLNDNGRKLAIETGKALKDVKFDIAISSPLSRTKETAEIILKESGNNCEIIFDRRIMEINMGDYEGTVGTKELLQPLFTDPFNVEPFPNGECIKDVIKRTNEFLMELVKKDYNKVLVSTHGCALRAMLNSLYEDKENFWHTGIPLNCCVNVVSVENGEIKLLYDDIILYDDKYRIDRFKDLY